jgi:uncharacterized protein YndB with AHSA1/START domain
MSETRKPTRKLELTVDVDAPPEKVWKALTEGEHLSRWFPPQATVSRPGAGGEVTFSWSPEMTWTTKVDAWEPGTHLRWLDENAFLGPGTVITVDYHLSTEGGKTRVRLVQSGFGESEGWDDFFKGTETGWSYFLYNLKVYLERHFGRARTWIAERLEFTAPREKVWKHVASAAAGLVIGANAATKAGDWVQLKLADPATVRATVALLIEGHALALRIAELGDALLFIEFEVGAETFNVGLYLSVYDPEQAARMEEGARKAFRAVKESFR